MKRRLAKKIMKNWHGQGYSQGKVCVAARTLGYRWNAWTLPEFVVVDTDRPFNKPMFRYVVKKRSA